MLLRASLGAPLHLLALFAALLEVHFVDVGQGDAALVVSPERRTVLIDAGPPEAGPHVVQYLRERGIGPLDLVLSTHPHLDHIGGMARVLTQVGARRFMDPGFTHPLDTYGDLLKLLETKKIPVLDAAPGRRIALDSGAVLEVLWPAKPFLTGTRSDANANSVVARLVYGKVAFLFMGDAEAETEKALLRGSAELGARVFKVAHHGSGYATSAELLARVKPEHAVISCGRGNDYGHPAPEALERLKRAKARVWRTDLDGGIVFRTDGVSLDVEPGAPRLADALASETAADDGAGPAAAPAAAVVRAAAGGGEEGLVDLNRATEAELNALPGIGPAKARAILEWRERNGPFTSVEQLDDVKGIGPALLAKVRPHVTVGVGRPAAPAPPASPTGPPAVPAPAATSLEEIEKESPAGKVNINTATVEELTSLQGVGPSLAQRIVDHRASNGPYRRIADLDAVKGIGPSFLAKNMFFVTVKVDVNEAPEPALRAVGLSEKTARALVEARRTRGRFRSEAELRALVPEAEWKAAEGLLWLGGG